MGVLGLAPFLQKIRPDIFNQLPNRLRALTGKTIVIDGTLITQRLHFAPVGLRYRHVLGWYRIINEIRENGVNAICVFDGARRSAAKAAEIFRRKQALKLTKARGVLEAERLQRLTQIETVLQRHYSMDDSERQRVEDILKNRISHDEAFIPLAPDGSQAPLPYVPPLASDRLEGRDFASTWYEEVTNNAFDLYPDRSSYADVSFDGLPRTSDHLTIQSSDFDILDPAHDVSLEGQALTPTGFTSNDLVSLYQAYRATFSKLLFLSSPSLKPPDSAPETDSDFAMSKAQYELTLEEGRFWELVASSSPKSSAEVETVLRDVVEKSATMAQSYDRRCNPPTTSTYQECREIVCAMGIPCIETDGPYEAEALASALVLSGYADYVASEDTDVLVYGAPLLRNLTSRSAPLVAVSGVNVRESLELSQQAYIDFVLLLGTDFSQRIKNVGPARALRFIKKHGSIEAILQEETKYPPRIAIPEYLDQVDTARSVFKSLPSIPDAACLKQGEYNQELVTRILHKFDLEGHAHPPDAQWDFDSGVGTQYFGDDPRLSSKYTESSFTY
ncbi:PIN domain-like protein [Fistulina hepatica ATCC 64428]|uniref:PIN domain-like protein n=1 Tax=Fistulina hepatica ATCC 64428 TaxID=1128425 RepID=A0A0D7ABW2_9AGAR|nr:PIN domain-like protein [Fistulina hepatica ATCC 64428]